MMKKLIAILGFVAIVAAGAALLHSSKALCLTCKKEGPCMWDRDCGNDCYCKKPSKDDLEGSCLPTTKK